MSTANRGYIDDLGFLGNSKLDPKMKEAGAIRLRGTHFDTDKVPEKDEAYRFKKEDVKVLQFFFDGGINRCISLTGDTGTGKTSLIEQACARLNWPLEPFSAHDRATMFELVGGHRLVNGNTVWEDGPLLSAMRTGAVLLIDEVNIMPPEVLTGLNRVLERFTYLIPETGELVKAHQDFRVAITGNSLNGENKGSYKGVSTMNIAFMNRFTLGIEVDWMTSDAEAAMLQTRFPTLSEKVANTIADFAFASRMAFRGEDPSLTLRVPMSPRTTMAIANKVVAYSSGLSNASDIEETQFTYLRESMQMCYFWLLSKSEQDGFRDACQKLANTLLGNSKVQMKKQ
jgi:cobaltochelatase CobS